MLVVCACFRGKLHAFICSKNKHVSLLKFFPLSSRERLFYSLIYYMLQISLFSNYESTSPVNKADPIFVYVLCFVSLNVKAFNYVSQICY